MKYKLLVIVFITIFLQACSSQSEENEFTAIDGKLDLAEWDATSAIPLNGQWEFYWNQLLSPTDFTEASGLNQAGTIKVPSTWNSHSQSSESLSNHGYATYRLHVSMVETDDILGLRLPTIHTNYNLWIDDQLVATSGKVGTNEQISVPEKETKVVYFSPENNTFIVTLQVSNYHFATGGVWEPIHFGTAETIHSSYFTKTVLQSIMLGVLILSGIYHIGLAVFRKTDSYFFYFGVFCIVAALRYLMIGDVLFTKMFPNLNWEFTMKLDYISLYSHVPLFALVLYRLYQKESYKWFIKVSIMVAILYDLLTIFTSARVYTSYLMYFQLFMIISVVYALIVVTMSLKRKHEESYYLLTGILALMASILFDIFGSLLRLPELNLYPVGIAIFIICFSLVLSKRLSSSLDLSEELAEDLSQLNSELETKVEQRTQQIQKSNKKLEELNQKLKEMALVDGLTNIPNRRSFDEYFDEQYETCLKENTPLSLFLLDIDFFKNYNDWYGHQKGDKCLKLVAQALNKIPDGLVARYGGEEFVCVLPNKTQDDAEQIANELNKRIGQLAIPHEKSAVSTCVTVSIGVRTVIPSKTTKKKELVKEADRALYQAKTSGRNRVVSYSHL